VAAVAAAFADGPGGAVGLVVDSYGMLALALDRRSAAEELRIAAGDQVRLTRLEPGGADSAVGPVTSPVELRPGRSR
jgi:hypothetical protein